MKISIVTDNLNGHRYSWLEKIIQRAPFDTEFHLFLLTSAEDNLKILDLAQQYPKTTLTSSNYFSKKELIDGLKNAASIDREARFIIWEGEKWVHFLLRTKLRCKIIFMRPYQSERTRLILPKTICKYLLYVFLTTKRNLEFRLLAIPGSKPVLMEHFWVDDDFELPTVSDTHEFKLNDKIYDILKFYKSHFVICVPGFISERKNPRLALTVHQEMRSKGYKVCLFFCGRIESNLKEFFSLITDPDVIVFDDYLKNDEYMTLLSVVDAILINYSNVGSSGIVIEALTVGTPTVFSGSRHWRNLATASAGLLRLTSFEVSEVVEILESFMVEKKKHNPAFHIPNPKLNVIDFMIN